MLKTDQFVVSWNNGDGVWKAMRKYPVDDHGLLGAKRAALKLYEDLLNERVGLSGKLTETTLFRVVHVRVRKVDTIISKLTESSLARYEDRQKRADLGGGAPPLRAYGRMLVRSDYKATTKKLIAGPMSIAEWRETRMYVA